MKWLSEMTWADFKATTLEEKVKLMTRYLQLNDAENEYVKASEVHALLQLFDLAEKTDVQLNSSILFSIQGAVLEYYKIMDIYPEIVACRDGSIWVGDCNYCLVIDEYGVSFPSYYIPTENTMKISLDTITFVIENLPLLAFARC